MSKFYKILPEDLVCNDFQYQEGLNIDTKPINDEECSNGLHFSDAAHIMGFCGYGDMIADVEVPDDAIVYHFEEKSKADKIILKNIRPLWNYDTIKGLANEGVEFMEHDIPLLLIACKRGNLDFVKLALKLIPKMDANAISQAFRCGYLDIVKYVMEEQQFNILDNYLCICNACQYDQLEIIRYLIEDCGIDIHEGEEYIKYLLLRNQSFQTLQYLLARGFSLSSDDLSYAISLSSNKCLKFLVEEVGIDIHANNEYALRHAAICCSDENVSYLLDLGADIHAFDDQALRMSSSVYVSRTLLDHGANVHAENEEALMRAVKSGSKRMVSLLIEHGANVKARKGAALRMARKRGYKGIEELILAAR